jgi:hypothetical protein
MARDALTQIPELGNRARRRARSVGISASKQGPNLPARLRSISVTVR